MKRFFSGAMLGGAILGYLAGYALSPGAVVATRPAQAQKGAPSLNQSPYPPLAPDQPAQAQVWNGDDMRKLHADRIAAAAAGKLMPEFTSGMRSRTHTVGLITRLQYETPRPSRIAKILSQFDDAEQHEGMSDVMLVVAGSGTMVVGGEIENRQYRPASAGMLSLSAAQQSQQASSLLLPGEFVGQPISGGVSYKVKAGDLINVPPGVAHWPQPDPGGLTYALIKVNVGLYPWAIAR
jgi:mannose-6-phosphate isomerase-like protein (cupin superfamily)